MNTGKIKKPKKKVAINKPQDGDEEESRETSLAVHHRMSVRITREEMLQGYLTEIAHDLDLRTTFKCMGENEHGDTVEVTPKAIDIYPCPLEDKFQALHSLVEASEIYMRERPTILERSSRAMSTSHAAGAVGVYKLSMDDIINGIESRHEGGSRASSRRTSADPSEQTLISQASQRLKADVPVVQPFVKIMLRKSEEFELYEQHSCVVDRNTEEAKRVELDNREYDYLTIGKGKIRRRSDADAQTIQILYKTRDVNTNLVNIANTATFVSNYEYYDTLESLKTKTTTISLDVKALKTFSNKVGVDPVTAIFRLPNFKLASMIMTRLLAGNIYYESQRRFRNMTKPDPLDMDHMITYRFELLFRFTAQTFDGIRRAVTDMSWCAKNGDILAVGYGIYSFSAMHVPSGGYVCIWNIKNPENPERCYYFEVPVVSVEFSPFVPTLLAVGLYDGTVTVLDITDPQDPPVAVSQRSTSPSCEAVMAIKWISQGDDEGTEIEPFLTLSQDGSVTKFRIINSPYLLGFKQMVLERVEGHPEGLMVKAVQTLAQQSNRHPQGLNLTMHPTQKDIYYVMTDEGCLHKCSTNYPHQHLEVEQVHEGSVSSMDFSPWSPKLFLTCGNDWCIRIWMDAVYKPLITLRNTIGPIHCAMWSRTHSTIIVAINRADVDIWDIRRSTLNPVASINVDSSFHTMGKFSLCGRCLALGNERGNVLMCALEDFPFPPHFQYEELEAAIYKAIETIPDLVIEVKTVGLSGYSTKGYDFNK